MEFTRELRTIEKDQWMENQYEQTFYIKQDVAEEEYEIFEQVYVINLN